MERHAFGKQNVRGGVCKQGVWGPEMAANVKLFLPSSLLQVVSYSLLVKVSVSALCVCACDSVSVYLLKCRLLTVEDFVATTPCPTS